VHRGLQKCGSRKYSSLRDTMEKQPRLHDLCLLKDPAAQNKLRWLTANIGT
jgi:hypothetical protein